MHLGLKTRGLRENNVTEAKRLIIGISGASGAIYGIRLLEVLKETGIQTHLVMSRSSQLTLAGETDWTADKVQALADVVHPIGNLGASISSGSFKTLGMVIAPCSMRTLGEIAHAITPTLLTRAADVVLKERRRLVVLVRETPLNAAHLKNMLAVTEMGGIIAPPVPAFYRRPHSVDELVDHTVGRVLDLFDIESDLVKRWKGMHEKEAID